MTNVIVPPIRVKYQCTMAHQMVISKEKPVVRDMSHVILHCGQCVEGARPIRRKSLNKPGKEMSVASHTSAITSWILRV